MSVAFYTHDFGMCEAGGAVTRGVRDTVLVVDERLDRRGQMLVALELLTDAELAEWLPTPEAA